MIIILSILPLNKVLADSATTVNKVDATLCWKNSSKRRDLCLGWEISVNMGPGEVVEEEEWEGGLPGVSLGFFL